MATDSKNLKLCRVTSAVKTAFDASTPASGSVYWDETEKSLRVGDGETAGGIAIPADAPVVATGTAISKSLSDWCSDISCSFHPIDIVSGVKNAKILFKSDRRGSGQYSRGAVQSSCYDRVNNIIYMLHLQDIYDTSTGARSAAISRHDGKTCGWKSTIDQVDGIQGSVGHQGLDVEYLQDGNIKLWSSSNYGLDGGTALRFSYASTGITNIEKYKLLDISSNNSLTPCISYDQRFLLVKGSGYVYGFSLSELVEGGPGNYVGHEIFKFPVNIVRADGGTGFQAMCCDGHYVYIMASTTSVETTDCIYCYSITGSLISKNLDVNLGVDSVTAYGGTYKESESLFIMPVDGIPTLVLGVFLDSDSTSSSTPKAVFFYAIGRGSGAVFEETLINMRNFEKGRLEEGINISTYGEGGLWFKGTTDEITGWPTNLGANGIYGCMGDPSGIRFEFVCRYGTMDDNNYMMAYRTNNGTASRWWYNAVLKMRCYVTDEGTLSGWCPNVSSISAVEGEDNTYIITLEYPIDIATPVFVTPMSSTLNTSYSGVARVINNTQIKVKMSASVPFAVVAL